MRLNRSTARRCLRLIVITVAIPHGGAVAQSNWPRWRGPEGNGHTAAADLPRQWDGSFVAWKVPMKGSGQSSPIVWENRIFLTSALEDGRQRLVLAFDAQDGKPLWEHIAWSGEPEPIHQMNSWASASCATDGEIVAAFFGRGGLHGYTLDGKHLWSRDLGRFEMPWGTAACPVVVGDLVIQNCDADFDSRIVGVDKRTGEIVWSTPRPNFRGWSTPILIQAEGHAELVVNGHAGVTAYDPASGKELWFCKSFNGRGEPTVTPAGSLLCAVNGLVGDIYAIRPGGTGDVTASHMAWHVPRRGGRDTPSPIVIDRYIVVVDLKGIAICYDALSGHEYWKERLCEQITASPIAAGGLAYFLEESGTTTVIKPGPTLEVVARNTLGTSADETFRASLTPAGGRLFTRSQHTLYCIKK
ncbi:MAG: hypothetical protein EXS05_00345 [Planctomycetaceae bacterium]|nr:hypothetical protein [Planctomycetaceae bacterium]